MRKQRQQYSAEFKAKVALEAIKGVRTVNEIGAHYEVHPTQVAQWKKQAVEHLRAASKMAAKPTSEQMKNYRTCSTSRSASSK